ncbi:TonB-dependent receptor domain-containing protein [Flavihumibacter stibioxidans]|uniref:TonB-dependent receptor n=1 Tax=Flavihumibacter stibioxidans TaxID=1834163 RepID=A0ABR7M3I7_9BACT|nr:TonB-dependent receptor [Flavihumibacter stibioxidans]MBC6489588.1 hypothetical protein [Flavihumibacter stibioxidans]
MKIISGKLSLLILLAHLAIVSFAQQTIQLKEKNTLRPIAFANYQLGKQKGQSDKDGFIRLAPEGDNYLFLTHISFEELALTPAELREAMGRGWILLEPASALYLNPVTVYALKGKENKESVKLEHGDWVQHDAGQVLQQIPGFAAIKKSGAFGFDPVFRGFKLDQLALLTNGVMTSTAACPNRMDPPSSQVLVSQADQVEILKGPHSFRYGPAMGAIINFKTAAPEFREKPELFGRFNTGYESNGDIYRAEGQLGVRGKKFQLSGVGSYSKGHNYSDGNDSIIPARFSRGAVGINADVLVKADQQLSLSVTRNFARKTDFPVLMMDLLSDDTWMLNGQYKISGKHRWYNTWTTQVYGSFVDHRMGNELRPSAASMLSSVDANTKTWGGRTEFAVLTTRSQLYFGADMKLETATGDRIRKMITGPMAGKTFVDTVWQNGEIRRGGLFGEWYHQLNLYRLSVSGRLDLVQGSAGNPSSKFTAQYSSTDQTDINGSFSAGISRQWNNHWQAGFWLGRGVRSANLTERYINSLQIGMDPYEMLGNPDLKPEANNQADLMIGYKSGNTSVQLNAFASLVKDYISSSINPDIKPRFGAPGVRQYINIDEARLAGFEFSWQQQWLPVLQHQLTAAYTWGENKTTGKPLPEIAPMDLRYRLEGKLFRDKIMPYGQLRHSLKQDRIADDFGEKKTASFTTLDLGARAVVVKNLQLTVAVNNITDVAYREHLSRYIRPTLPLNAPGRSLVLMASYSF